MSALLNAALLYAQHGWPVFPLNGKQPRTAHGFRDATTDPDKIREWWWVRWPDAGIGVATEPAGLAVIDIDGPVELELPPTATVETRPGRQHLIYSGDVASSQKKLAPHVDTRGRGGYIVVPPSVHPDTGEPYRWLDKRRPAPLPEWVSEALQNRTDNSTEEQQGEHTPYGRAVLNSELARLVQAPEGQRNGTLFRVAVRVFELAKGGSVDASSARTALYRAAAGTGLEEREIGRTLASAWERAEARSPGDSDEDEPKPAAKAGPSRFLTLRDLRDIPPPRWLVPLMLPEGFTVLYGRRGGGKTFVALDMALALASKGQSVVYCAGEGVSGLASRVDAWTLAHPDLDPSEGFRVLAHGAFPRLIRETSVEHFLEAMSEVRPKLVVIDTWRRALAGASTSSDEVTTQAIDVLDTLRDRHSISSLVIHHPRRPSKEERNPPEAGSGALLDNADFAWKLWYPDGDETAQRVMYNEKAKEWDTLPPLRPSLRPRGDSLYVSPSAVDLIDDG